MSDWKKLTSEINYDLSIISQGHIDYVRKIQERVPHKSFLSEF